MTLSALVEVELPTGAEVAYPADTYAFNPGLRPYRYLVASARR